VAVKHHCGSAKSLHGGEHVRAPVWVEQELAIAAFLRQAQDRNIAVVLYIQKSIEREGVRDDLLLGALKKRWAERRRLRIGPQKDRC